MVIPSQHYEVENLKRFRELSSEKKNHTQLLKDKKAILYAATQLNSKNPGVISLCLDVFENFILNEECRMSLVSTFGVYESLDDLCIRLRHVDDKTYRRASDLTEMLRNSAPPAYSTRSRTNSTKSLKKQITVYLLYIKDLSMENRHTFETALVKIKGVVSFLIDIEVKQCTLRICPKATIKEVVEKMFVKCGLRCWIVRKDRDRGIETFYDLLEDTPNTSYIEYADEDFFQKSGVITMAPLDKIQNPGLLNSVKKFWTESFYW